MREIPRIITADSPLPKEIDDGVFVEKLGRSDEIYKVGVCIADASSLYEDPAVRGTAKEKRAARYELLNEDSHGEDDGEDNRIDDYDPMLPVEAIKDLELSAGGLRDAMIATFKVGPKLPPRDLRIRYGKVEVVANMTYLEFAEFTAQGSNQRFRRASEAIKAWLNYRAYGDHDGDKPNRPDGEQNISSQRWKRGSKTNEGFMVGVNHLVGKMLADENWQAGIFRVHDPQNSAMAELLSASAAYFSITPGLHDGLNVSPYFRNSSPLRRFDDFVNNYMLKKRYLGLPLTEADIRDVRDSVESLNEGLVQASRLAAEKRSIVRNIGAAVVDKVGSIAGEESELLAAAI
jgi:hypothetical protein